MNQYQVYYNSNKNDYRIMQTGGGKKLNKRNARNSLNRTSNIKNMTTQSNVVNMNLSEPWFTLITLGLKTIEGRLNKGKFKELNVGDTIKWENSDFKYRSIMTRITKKVEYKSFEKYLESEGMEKCLPAVPSLEHGLSVYYKYYTKDDEAKFGIVAIHLELV
jgi:ASC-1-like (ASCH) protein